MDIYKSILRVPVIKTIVFITNSYAYRGDENASVQFAGISLWVKAFFVPCLLSGLLTAFTLLPMILNFLSTCKFEISSLPEFSSKPGALIVSVLPNLLGFGIGVYALLFSLGATFVKEFDSKIKELKLQGKIKHGSKLMLNSDVAFPITVLILCISISIFQQVFPSVLAILIAAWASFWYSIIMLIEIVGVLFGLVDNSLIDKATESETKR